MYAAILKRLLFAFALVVLCQTPGLAQINPRIVREVRHELVTLPYYGVFDWLEYEVQPNGTVTLKGRWSGPRQSRTPKGA